MSVNSPSFTLRWVDYAIERVIPIYLEIYDWAALFFWKALERPSIDRRGYISMYMCVPSPLSIRRSRRWRARY